MTYYSVTKRNGAFGVPVSELLKTKQWREAKKERRLRGNLLVTVRCDYNTDNVFYTRSHVFNSGSELCRIISNEYCDFNVFRYGIDQAKGIIELDIVKPK